MKPGNWNGTTWCASALVALLEIELHVVSVRFKPSYMRNYSVDKYADSVNSSNVRILDQSISTYTQFSHGITSPELVTP